MTANLSLKEIQKEYHGTLQSYVIGFIASLVLTGTSFLLVITKWLSENTLMYAIMGLAIVQVIVQLLFFLHVGKEDKPRWETYALFFTIVVLLVIIIGSLWIMHDLNMRTMSHMNKETMIYD